MVETTLDGKKYFGDDVYIRSDALALRYPSPPSGWDGTCTRQLSNMRGVQQKRAADLSAALNTQNKLFSL
jgi:hypothetical protein